MLAIALMCACSASKHSLRVEIVTGTKRCRFAEIDSLMVKQAEIDYALEGSSVLLKNWRSQVKFKEYGLAFTICTFATYVFKEIIILL